MAKLLVETTGDFQIIDTANDQVIRWQGYSVVGQSSLLGERIGNGQVRIIAELNDTATDADWLDAVKQSKDDLVLAVEAFKAEFPLAGTEPDADTGKPAKK